MLYRGLILIFVLILSSCVEHVGELDQEYVLDVPTGFPKPNIPKDNKLTESRVELGRLLFNDPRASKTGKLSCATCHIRELAFTDGKKISPGVHDSFRGNRNTPTLANMVYYDSFFMEGGVPSLEFQALGPILNENEMNIGSVKLREMMQSDSVYVRLSRIAYDREPDVYVFAHSLAAFERTLISGNSRFDKYFYQGDNTAISPMEKRGWKLFNDKKCSSCHSGFLFSDLGFYNIGLYDQYEDPGKGRLTDVKEDLGRFKTPSLRNIELTSPYMHDGSMATLGEVIDHFANGGSNHDNKDSLIQGFELSNGEKEELISFLKTLTDSAFVSSNDGD